MKMSANLGVTFSELLLNLVIEMAERMDPGRLEGVSAFDRSNSEFQTTLLGLYENLLQTKHKQQYSPIVRKLCDYLSMKWRPGL